MSQWLTFNTEAKFDAAQAAITTIMGYPITGNNAATGQPDATAQKTTSWFSKIVADNDASLWIAPNDFPSGCSIADITDYVLQEEDTLWFPTEI